MKTEYILLSENIESEIINKRIIVKSDITIKSNVKFIDCDIDYSETTGKITFCRAKVLLQNCCFTCHGIDEDNSFLIECKDKTELEFKDCVFKYCENFIVSKSNNTKVSISNAKIHNPGDKFLYAVLGKKSMFEFNDSLITLDADIEYTNQTIIFNVARVDQKIHPHISNVNIISEKKLENVRWFLCMGAYVKGGKYTNISNVFNGIDKIEDSNFENCKKVVNWSIPVVRSYSISKNTISWINENIEVLECNFLKCEKIIGLGYKSKVCGGSFVSCVAPMIVSSVHGGIEINGVKFRKCQLTTDKFSAYILLSDYQDKMSERSHVSYCEVVDDELREKNQFLRIILNKNSKGNMVANRPSVIFKECTFLNSVRDVSNLIGEEIIINNTFGIKIVKGIQTCKFDPEDKMQENDDEMDNDIAYTKHNNNKPSDGGNFSDIL